MSIASPMINSPFDATALQVVKTGIALSEEIENSAISDVADTVFSINSEDDVNDSVASYLSGPDETIDTGQAVESFGGGAGDTEQSGFDIVV